MTTQTLTDRYVDEVARRIPADQRGDVAAELRATIDDTIDASETTDRGSAERSAIAELGDPIRLAAQYADRPLALIGPDFYPTYVRVLTMLLSTVAPIIIVIAIVADIAESNDFGSAIVTGWVALVMVGTQMIAWATIVFAVLERVDAAKDAREEWTPDKLPRPRQSKPSAVACAAAVWNATLLALIVWQYAAEPYSGSGDRLAVLDPDLWSGWIWPILIGLAAIVVLEVVRIGRGSWSLPLVAWYAAAEAAVSLPLAWLFYDQRLLNPAFESDFNGDWTAPDSAWSAAAAIVLIIGAVEVAGRFREARALR